MNMLKRLRRYSVARVGILVVLMALAAFLVAGLSSVLAISNGFAQLDFGVKPCASATAPCTAAEMLVKDSVTVSIEMKHFKVENAQGYLAWEATICWPWKNLQLTGTAPTFKGGPEGYRVVGPAFVTGDFACQSIGAAVAPGEAGSLDLGNLASLEFLCVQAGKPLSVSMVDGTVITADKKTSSGQFGFVSIDCRAGTVSISTSDTDGDGCSDESENGPDETLGGQRDYRNPWDYYDINGDGIVDLFTDILGVIQHYSLDGGPPYDANFDRGPSAGPDAWNMTAPDGSIDLFTDILGVISQYGHTCA